MGMGWPLVSLIVRHLPAVSVLGALAYLVGRRLLLTLPLTSADERVAICTTLGLGVIGQLLTVLGLLGRLTRGPMLLVAALLLVATHRVWLSWIAHIRWPKAPSSFGRYPTVIATLATIAAALLLIIVSLYPPVRGDDIGYHLPVASLFARTGRIQMTPWLRFAALPRSGEMLFASMLLFGDDLDAQLVRLLMLALSVLALHGYCARVASARAGLWAAALWLGSPLVVWLGSCCYVDVGLTLFTTVATIAVLVWREEGGSWLSVAAVMAGFAASTKYQGLWFVMLLGIFILVFERQPRSAIRFVATATVIALPWYLIDAVMAGDPIYPLGGPLFGYKWWTADDLKIHAHWWDTIGRGRSIAALLQLPWNLVRFPRSFIAEARVSPAYLLAIPAIAIAMVRDARVRWLAGLILAYTLMWFWTAQLVRFLLPCMALLALAAVLATDRWVRRLPWQRAITVTVSLALSAPSLWWVVEQIRVSSWPPTTRAAREAFLARTLPSYRAIRFLNQERGQSYRLYAFPPLDGARYYAQGQMLGDWLGPGRFQGIYQAGLKAEQIRDRLARLNVDFLLVPNLAQLPSGGDPRAAFTCVYQNADSSLYELKPSNGH